MSFKFQHKHSFLLRDVVISGLFAMGVISLLVLALGAVAVNYGRNDIINPAFANNYNKLNSLLDDLEATRTAATSTSGLNLLGTFDIAFNAVFTSFKLVLNTMDLFAGMTASVVSDYTFLDAGVVKILLGVLLAGLLVTIIYTWLSSITRGRI